MPAVDLSAARLVPTLPWVETNDEEIARLAAEHLLERGFKRFAYCGDARFNWSVWREKYFVARLKAAGLAAGRALAAANRQARNGGRRTRMEETLEAVLSRPGPGLIFT